VPTAVILGSGTSNGVPALGMEYPAGFFDDPRNRRNRACLALKGPTGNLIVDCPPELRLMAHAAAIHDIEAVLITHSHADHVMGMDDLRSICMKTGQAVPVYTLPRYAEDIRRIFSYAFAEFPKGVFVPRFDLIDLPETPSTFEVGGMTVRTFLVEHGRIPVIGVRVNDFAYITDVSRIPDEAMAELQGLDTFVVDAVRYQPHPNHFHFELALETAARIGARRTILTHLSGDYDHPKTSRELPEGVELAYDGLTVAI
jgi:phosphoribosyl 1,2-cyclic phosphate phosphodiesterase